MVNLLSLEPDHRACDARNTRTRTRTRPHRSHGVARSLDQPMQSALPMRRFRHWSETCAGNRCGNADFRRNGNTALLVASYITFSTPLFVSPLFHDISLHSRHVN
jgi:hypothetical protein